MDDEIKPASRVFQLESFSLSKEFDKTIDQLIENLEIPLVSEELKLATKFYLNGHRIKNGTTIGMSMYNLKYHESNGDNTLRELKRNYKLTLLTACNLIVPYLIRKFRNVENSLGQTYFGRLKLTWLTLDNVTMAFKSISLANFLLFLQKGKYLTLQERLLGIVPGMSAQDYTNNMSLNKAQMEILNRDVIWKAIADLFVTLMPYINVTQLKNRALKLSHLMPQSKTEINLSEKLMRVENCKKCAICDKQPFNPYIIGCSHVFCYYCLQSRYQSDKSEGYNCPTCKYNTKDVSQVQRYRIHVLAQLKQ